MADLGEMQFEILPTEDAADGYVFGIGREVSVDGEGFVPGAAEWLTQDQSNTRRGGTAFGRDVLGSPVWAWNAHVNTYDVEEAVDALERMTTAWRPEDLMKSPSAVTALRYRLGNRWRRVYGRPRRFEAPPSNLILSGYVPISCDFTLSDAHVYDDVESSIQLVLPGAGAGSGAGFVFPATAPMSTLPLIPPDPEEQAAGQVVVGGTARAYPRIRFAGPWLNPTLTTDDWTLKLNTEIPDGDWIEVDTRPWKLTVLSSDGSSAAGALGRRVWLEDLNFAPGTRPNLAIGGYSSSGGATCTISWRSAFNSI